MAGLWRPRAAGSHTGDRVSQDTSADDSVRLLVAFHRGLNEAGYVEGQNVAVEYRWAENQLNRLPALAADLVRRQVAVIVAGGVDASLAAKAATATIPIVFSTGADPVQIGLVANLNRPAANVTGVIFLGGAALDAKRLELLHQLVPKTTTIAYLINPSSPNAEHQMPEVETAAQSLGLQLHVLKATGEREIDTAFATIVQQHIGALLIASDALDVDRILELHACFGGTLRNGAAALEFTRAGDFLDERKWIPEPRIRFSAGWGTFLTNDFRNCNPLGDESFNPVSLVCKLADADGRPAVKLSDNYSKALGPPEEIERYRRVFGTIGITNAPLVA